MSTVLSGHRLLAGAIACCLVLLVPPPAAAQDEPCPPKPGTQFRQTSASTASLSLEVIGIKEPMQLQLAGDVTTTGVVDANMGVQTEIVAMSLTGEHPLLGKVTLTQSPKLPSKGLMLRVGTFETPTADPYCGSLDSFFDVFFEITVEGGEVQLAPLANPRDRPLRVTGDGPVPLDHTKTPFQFVQLGEEVPVLDATGKVVALVKGVVHKVEPQVLFKRGDANCDGCVDRKDAVFLNEYLFANGPAPCCQDAADADDSGAIDAADPIYILNYVISGGAPPPAPGPKTCGPDPTADRLVQCNYPAKLCDTECPEPSCFPPAGVDIMGSNVFHDIDIPGIGLIHGNLSGPVTVRRSDPHVDPDTGLQCIDTEIVAMQLKGTDPVAGTVIMTLDPCQPSKGTICEKVPGTCFPADSFFDVFVEVQLPDLGICFYACQPARMRTVITSIPPLHALYNLNVGEGSVVPLYRGPCMEQGCDRAIHPCFQDPRPPPAAFIIKAVHEPVPPDDCTCFPPAGQDVMVTNLTHGIVIPGFELSCDSFSGPIVVQRSDPYLNEDGLCTIDTEITRMEMTGQCSDGSPAVIRLNPDRPSKGFITALEPGNCYPAQSCFNVFFEVEVRTAQGVLVFRNCTPAVMCCRIEELPPLGCPYQLRNAPIQLYQVVPGAPSPCLIRPLPNPAGALENATHTPEEEPEPCCPEYGPGVDVFDSTLLHDIEIPGIGVCKANLRGPVKINRGQPYRNPLTQRCCVDVEMIELELTGNDPLCGPIKITLDPRRPSRGRICELEPGTCFPAQSCFEMYVRVELPELGLVLVACQPARMCCEIGAIPPIGCLYNLDIGAGDVIPLYTETAAADVCSIVPPPEPRAFINKAVHRPEPPCDEYPPEGDDEFPSELSHRIRLFGLGTGGTDLICDADMSGPVVVHRQDPEVDPVTGLCQIRTEIVQMELHGVDPLCGDVTVRLRPNRPSLGLIREKDPDSGFPADSFFDVFVEVDIPEKDLVLVNCAPVHMETVIDAIPPVNMFYRLDLSAVPLYRLGQCELLPNPDLAPMGVIEAASHAPRDPSDECPEYGPGRDIMNSILRHDIVIFGVGDETICKADLRGKVVVDRGAPYTQVRDDGTVVTCISTRMISMDLEGVDPDCGPIKIRLNPDQASRGTICANDPAACFPATSCFDVYIEVEVMDRILVNCDPVVMCCTISAMPPYGCVYRFDPGQTIALFNKGECIDDPTQAPPPVGEIRLAEHTPVPCGPLNLRCVPDPDTHKVEITWQDDPDCPCEAVKVTRTAPDGTEVDIPVPAGQMSVTDIPPCPPGVVGPVVYTYCVTCIKDGVESEPVCCEVEINCELPECEIELVCDPAGENVVLSWTVSPPNCCEEFVILVDGSEVRRVPGSDTQATVPCEPGTHTYCVQCVKPDGTVQPITNPEKQCCTVTCPCSDDASTIVNLVCVNDPDNNAVTLTWDVANPECCDKFQVTMPDGTTTIAEGATSITLDCMEGEFCVQCVKVDGSLGPKECCDVTCEQGGLQRPCDCNQDSLLDISDGVCILGFLFLGKPLTLPCGDGTATDPANLRLVSCNGDGKVDITDAIHVFNFLFLGGPPPALGLDCLRIPDCPDACQPAG